MDQTVRPIERTLRGKAGRQRPVESPRTMYPHSQEWHRTRKATVHLPASRRWLGLGLVVWWA